MPGPDPSSLKRIGVNWPQDEANVYDFINVLWQQQTDFFQDPGTLPDNNGWPTHDTGSTQLSQVSFTMPDGSNCPGPYELSWDGDGALSFANSATPIGTLNVGQSTGAYSVDVPGFKYSGTGPIKLVFDYTGLPLQFFIFRITATDRSSTGNYMKNVSLIRQADKTRFQAGFLFRADGYMKKLADLNPGFVRFLNPQNINDNRGVRWENRCPPGTSFYGTSIFSSPAYGAATGTNQWSLAAVHTGAKQTPALMQHGEVVYCSFTTGDRRVGPLGQLFLANVSNAANGVVTVAKYFPVTSETQDFTPGQTITGQTSGATATVVDRGFDGQGFRQGVGVKNIVGTFSASETIAYGSGQTATINGAGAFGHSYQTGDIVIHRNVGGMTQLENIPCTITKLDNFTYQTNVNTSGFSAFSGLTAYVTIYFTLNVGGRGAFPIVWPLGQHMGEFGAGYIGDGGATDLYFDKGYISSTTVTGAWIFHFQTAAFPVYNTGMPTEVSTRFMVELNLLAASLGKGPINMWIQTPIRGLTSSDPDYSAGSNWPVNMISTIKNGNGPSWPALPSNCYIIHETGNEHWNHLATGNACEALSVMHWGGTDTDGYYCLLAGLVIKDLKAAFPGDPQILYTIGGWAGFPGGAPQIFENIGGYQSDVRNTWQTPVIDQADGMNIAPYVNANDPTNLYQTYATGWAAAAGNPAAQAVFVTNYVTLLTGTDAADTATSINWYLKNHGGTIAVINTHLANVGAHGKKLFCYEGAADWPSTVNRGLTTDQAGFLIAVRSSPQWAAAWISFVQQYEAAGGTLPSVYTTVGLDGDAEAGNTPITSSVQGNRWSYNGSSYDTYGADHVEGSAFDATWAAMTLFNAPAPPPPVVIPFGGGRAVCVDW